MPFPWFSRSTRRRLTAATGIALAVALASPPAQAHDPTATPRAEPAQATHRHPDCFCRAQGSLFSVGTQVCLNFGNGAKVYRCAMDQNVTTWLSDGTGCPQS